MKLNTFLLLLFTFCNSLSAQDSAQLTISVEGLKSNTGSIRIGLYNKAEGFSKAGYAINGAIVDIAKDGFSYTFEDLAPANYAVAIYHDANNDEKLNTNLVGYPKENYGFSNNVFGYLGGVPAFEKAMVRVEENEVKSIVVKLR